MKSSSSLVAPASDHIMAPKSSEVIPPARIEHLFQPRWWQGPWAIATIASRSRAREPFWLLVASSAHKGMLLEIKFDAKGYVATGGRKQWRIRGNWNAAIRDGRYHYCCEKLGDEHVVKRYGTCSRSNSSGTEVPKTLGRFLYEQLDVALDPLQGNYVVQCLPAWSWDARLKLWALDFVGAALNAYVDDDLVAPGR